MIDPAMREGASDAATLAAAIQEADYVLESQGVRADSGLDTDEVDRRRQLHGTNSLPEAEKETLVEKFIENFKDPLILLLLGSAVVSLLVGQLDDALSITAAVIIVVTVAFVQEYKSEKSIEALTELVQHMCRVVRDNGTVSEISAVDLVPGDVVLLNIGDRVPADIRLFEAVSLKIEESVLTGETKASKKQPDVLDKEVAETMAKRSNSAYHGTLVVAGSGRGVVVATGENTELGQITKMMKDVEEKRTPLQKTMDNLGGQLSMFSFGIIAVIFLIGMVQGNDWLEMFTVGVSLAVAAIPEGLPVVVTVTLAVGVLRMAGKNAIVRKLPAVEALGATSVICVDKTGTLTCNQMTVTHIYTPTDQVVEVTGSGYGTNGSFLSNGAEIDVSDRPDLLQLIRTGTLCNNAILNDSKLIGQPTEGALMALAGKAGLGGLRDAVKRVDEIPFSSEQKWMATECEADPDFAWVEKSGNTVFYVKGAVEYVLDRCNTALSPTGKHEKLARRGKSAIQANHRDFASRGLRVVALAFGSSIDDLCYAGLVGITDPPREGVREAIEQTVASGVQIAMITGDSKETAIAIAGQLGFFHDGSRAFSGSEVADMTDDELASELDNVNVFYRMTPLHKMKIVSAFRKANHIVAMTGDGVNDAPALKMADIGIAMGIAGTDVCKEAAEMILVDDNFATITAAIEEGKCIFSNIKNFLQFQLATSVAALTLIALSTLLGFPLPLNPMQILWINIIMDGPPAQSLGMEPVDKEIIKRPPRDVNAPVITPRMVFRIVVAAAIMVVGTLYVFVREMEDGVVTRRDTTMAFTTFVMFQMWNALNCRSSEKSVLSVGLFNNRMFVYAVAGSLAGQFGLMYFSWFQEVFDCQPLSVGDLGFITALTASVTVVDEVRKYLVRNFLPQPRLPSREARSVRTGKYGEESSEEEE